MHYLMESSLLHTLSYSLQESVGCVVYVHEYVMLYSFSPPLCTYRLLVCLGCSIPSVLFATHVELSLERKIPTHSGQMEDCYGEPCVLLVYIPSSQADCAVLLTYRNLACNVCGLCLLTLYYVSRIRKNREGSVWNTVYMKHCLQSTKVTRHAFV